MAAAFDEELSAAFGGAIAEEEARDTGSNVLLGPAVDIARAPLGGRLPESMGKDLFLTSRLASAEVRAIQAQRLEAFRADLRVQKVGARILRVRQCLSL